MVRVLPADWCNLVANNQHCYAARLFRGCTTVLLAGNLTTCFIVLSISQRTASHAEPCCPQRVLPSIGER